MFDAVGWDFRAGEQRKLDPETASISIPDRSFGEADWGIHTILFTLPRGMEIAFVRRGDAFIPQDSYELRVNEFLWSTESDALDGLEELISRLDAVVQERREAL